MFEAFLTRILKFSEKTFRCLFLSKAIRTDLRISDASSKRFLTRVALVWVDFLILPCIDSWTNEYNEWSKISNWGQKLRLNSSHIDNLQFFLGSKFTSTAEGGEFYWLILDSRWQNEIIVRVGGFPNPGVCRQAFPSFPPLPLLLLSPFLRCNSLLPNPTETLATQAVNLNQLEPWTYPKTSPLTVYPLTIFAVFVNCGKIIPFTTNFVLQFLKFTERNLR